jgi:hypothetical protein
MSAQGDDDVEVLHRTSDRIERLLGELRGSTSPAAWARIEELVASLTGVYGRGLERVLEAFAGERGIDGEARERLCRDPLVESLLLLHGLHPAPTEERVARAVDRVRVAIGHAGGEIDVSFDEAATALTLRLAGDWRRCPVPAAAIEAALRRAVEEAAPEIARVAIEEEGVFATATSQGQGLIQIDLTRSHRQPPREATG